MWFSKKSPSNRNLKGDVTSASASGETQGGTTSPAVAAGASGNAGSAIGSLVGRFNPAAFALLAAAERGDVAEVARLLGMRNGGSSPPVQVNDRDELGRTALHFAAAGGHLDLARALVEVHGADLNQLTRALTPRSNLLVEDAEDEDQRALGRKTPLHMALQGRRFEVAHYLLAKGAAANLVSVDNPSTTALHLAAKYCPKDEESSSVTKTFTDMAGMLVMLLGATNQQDELGNTALHYAVYETSSSYSFTASNVQFFASEQGYLPLVSLLLKHQADPTIMNKDGDTPLLLAIRGSKSNVTLAMLNATAQPGMTPESQADSSKAMSLAKESEGQQQRGWLRKRIKASDKPKSKKKWQRRYVEMRGSSLAYFKHQQQASPSYEIDLVGATIFVSAPYNKQFDEVEELAADPNHPYVFAIKRRSDDKRGTTDLNDLVKAKVLQLSATTEDELLQWVQPVLHAKKQNAKGPGHIIDLKYDAKVKMALKRVASYFSDADQRETAEKDANLEDPSEATNKEEGDSPFEKRRNSSVPLYTPDLWNAENANQTEVAALHNTLKDMKDLKESSFGFGPVNNPYSIFQFTILMLKQLSLPLLTFKLEPSFLSAAGVVDPSKRMEQYRSLLHQSSMSSDCVQIMRVLLPLLRRLETHHVHNGLTLDRIVDLFVPIFARGRLERTPQEAIRQRYLARVLVEDFMRHHERLLEEKPEEGKDTLTTQLESEYSHFTRRVGSQGLLYLLGQEVEAIRQRWEEVRAIGCGESDSRIREWEKTIHNASSLGIAIQAEMRANEAMIARMHTSMAESQAAIDAMQPHWDIAPSK